MRFTVKLLTVLCVLVLSVASFAAEAPYYTMTELYDGQYAYTQSGYLPDGTFRDFNGDSLKRPADLFVDELDHLFISDEGNDRVVMTTLDGETIRVFGEDDFKSVGGIYVREGKLYAADAKKKAVFIYDVETGEKVFTLEHPGTPLYGVKAKFEPLKVSVDAAGNIYVISKGNTNGIAQFSKVCRANQVLRRARVQS